MTPAREEARRKDIQPMTRLISADSHVAVSLDEHPRAGASRLHEAFDDAIAEQARKDAEMRGGRKLSLGDWDMDAFRDPGYSDPMARLAAMDRDGVEAEVLYSEVSAFRASGSSRATGGRSAAPSPTTSASSPPSTRPAGRLLPGADHRHRLRGQGGRPARRPGRPLGPPAQLSQRVRAPRLPRRALRPAVGRAVGDRHLHQPSPGQPRLAL